MSNKEWALYYASKGFAVMPAHFITEDKRCSCGALGDYMGVDKHAMGKHPYIDGGHKEASKEASQIHLWWEMWPEANIQIATGYRSRIVVLDIDFKNGGRQSFDLLCRGREDLPVCPKVHSGGGGYHLYFRWDSTKDLRGRRDMRRGVDVMADGGRIIAPPSNHKSGRKYYWDDEFNLETTRLPELPDWLLSVIRTKNSPRPKPKRHIFANIFK